MCIQINVGYSNRWSIADDLTAEALVFSKTKVEAIVA